MHLPDEDDALHAFPASDHQWFPYPNKTVSFLFANGICLLTEK